MAKGRTNQPLSIKVADVWDRHPAVAKLREAGHKIIPIATDDADWIMHPAAGWHDAFFAQNDKGEFPFVEARLKGERARKRGKR
jgi:hypothetical protein